MPSKRSTLPLLYGLPVFTLCIGFIIAFIRPKITLAEAFYIRYGRIESGVIRRTFDQEILPTLNSLRSMGSVWSLRPTRKYSHADEKPTPISAFIQAAQCLAPEDFQPCRSSKRTSSSNRSASWEVISCDSAVRRRRMEEISEGRALPCVGGVLRCKRCSYCARAMASATVWPWYSRGFSVGELSNRLPCGMVSLRAFDGGRYYYSGHRKVCASGYLNFPYLSTPP